MTSKSLKSESIKAARRDRMFFGSFHVDLDEMGASHFLVRHNHQLKVQSLIETCFDMFIPLPLPPLEPQSQPEQNQYRKTDSPIIVSS